MGNKGLFYMFGGRRAGRKIVQNAILVDTIREMKMGQSVAVVFLDQTRIIKLEEVRERDKR